MAWKKNLVIWILLSLSAIGNCQPVNDDGLLQELRDMVKKLSMDVKCIREKVETIDENVVNLGEIVETNRIKLDQHLNLPDRNCTKGVKDGKGCDDAGQCDCKPNFSGLKCETCATGFYDFENDCKDCNCSKGVKDGKTCDSTGKCDCKLNFAGVKCDKCAVGYDDFHNGCKAGPGGKVI